MSLVSRLRQVVQPNPNFIEVYDNALTDDECNELRSYFESFPNLQRKGNFIRGTEVTVDTDAKSSVEIDNSRFSDGSRASSILEPAINTCLGKYQKKYPSLDHIYYWSYDDEYNYQRFDKPGDGYKQWHTEHGRGNPLRILAWIFYLNDAGAGTEFYHYKPNIKAKEGRCIIFPAHQTHVHKSEPNLGLKYIVTGFVSIDDRDCPFSFEE